MTIQHGVAKSFTGFVLARNLLKCFKNSEAPFYLETIAFEIVERSIVKTCGMGKNFQASENCLLNRDEK